MSITDAGKSNRTVVYKVLEKYLDDKVGEFQPYYRKNHGLYKLNKTFVSNRKNVKLNKCEQKTGVVELGIHVFLNLEDALTQHDGRTYRTVIVECEVSPKDHVADGIYGEIYNAAVYTQIIPRKVLYKNYSIYKDKNGKKQIAFLKKLTKFKV